MKALVLSGGAGTRLRPFSHSMPKQLIPIGNKPVLVHVLENVRALGITEIGVVVGERADEIATVLGDGSPLGVEITYLPQDRPRGLAHCVAIARDFLGDDDFVLYLGDCMLPDGVQDAAAAFRSLRPSAQVVVHKVADPRAFGVVELDEDGRVTALAEKPREPRSDLALTGVYFFTPDVHEAVAAVRPGSRGELEVTDALQWLVERDHDVHGFVHAGFWRDTGRIEDVLECNREVLERLRSHVAGEVDPASELIGPVVVEPGARVVRCAITGPVVIGTGALLEDCTVGPHTAIGAGCVLSGADIEYSIMLPGSSVREVRGIQGSVIGREATVMSSTAPGRHRLVVGDHADVEVTAR